MRHRRSTFAIVLAAAIVPMLCRFPAARAAEINHAAEGTATVSLQVYKKWIGASGDEANSEVRLSCGSLDTFDPRFINSDRIGSWDVPGVPEEGLFCSVREVEQETFIADVSDCQELLLVRGQAVDCTVVNTKVVKRIDMLNRYGLIIMVFVMLCAGLIAVRRFAPM